MTRNEYYEAIADFRSGGIEHRAMDETRNSTSSASEKKQIQDWEKANYSSAVLAKSKAMLARWNGDSAEEEKYERLYNSFTDKLSHIKDASLLQAEFQKIENAARTRYEVSKKNMNVAKHSDEPEEDNVLEHGTKWKNHKYIRIENGRYIYPDDLKKEADSWRETADYAKGAAASESKQLNRIMNDPKSAGTDKQTSARLNESAYRDAAAKANQKADELEAKGREEFKKESDSIVGSYNKRKDEKLSAIAKAGEEARNHSDSAAKAQAEGEAYQKWKDDKQEAQKNYENNIRKYANDAINAWITQASKIANGQSNENFLHWADSDLEDRLTKSGYSLDDRNSDLAKAMTEKWQSVKDNVPSNIRSIIDNIIYDLVDTRTGTSVKPKKLGEKLSHSFESKEAFDAALHQYRTNYIEHHGILGQKWGIRRFQNPDGTLTEAGKKRQSKVDKLENKMNEAEKKGDNQAYNRFAKLTTKNNWDTKDHLGFEPNENDTFSSVGRKYLDNAKNDRTESGYKKADKLQKKLDRIKVADAINDKLHEDNFQRDPSGQKHLGLLEQIYVNTSHFRKGKAYKEIKQQRLNDVIEKLRATPEGKELLDYYANKYKENPSTAIKTKHVSLKSKNNK